MGQLIYKILQKVAFGIFILLLTKTFSFAQEMIYNGSFEEYHQLPSDLSQLDSCKGWFRPSGGGTTPDYFHKNGGTGVRLPKTFAGAVEPLSGEGVVGMLIEENWKEFISGKLVKPTVSGNWYRVSVWVNNGANHRNSKYGSCFSINNIAIGLSTKRPIQKRMSVINVFSIKEYHTRIWDSTWRRFTFEFEADSAYEYITLGIFKNISQEDFRREANHCSRISTYMFFDSLSMKPIDAKVIDTTVCGNEKLKLLGPKGKQWQWLSETGSESSKDSFLVVTFNPFINLKLSEDTTIKVIGENETFIYNIDVLKGPKSSFLGTDTSLPCSTMFLPKSGNDLRFKYLWPNGSIERSYIFDKSGTFRVAAINENCLFYDTIQILFLNENDNFKLDSNFCQNDSLIIIIPGTKDSVIWDSGGRGNNIVISDTGAYKAMIYKDGCVNFAQITIVEKECNCQLFLPDAITINNDGLNENFQIQSNCNFKNYRLLIFNRWGQQIFETTDINNKWIGSYRGSEIPVDVYVYIVVYQFYGEGPKFTKGTITLIK